VTDPQREPPQVPPPPDGLLPETIWKWEWFFSSGEAANCKDPDLVGFRRLFRLYDERARLQAALADAGPEALTQAGPGGWN